MPYSVKHNGSVTWSGYWSGAYRTGIIVGWVRDGDFVPQKPTEKMAGATCFAAKMGEKLNSEPMMRERKKRLIDIHMQRMATAEEPRKFTPRHDSVRTLPVKGSYEAALYAALWALDLGDAEQVVVKQSNGQCRHGETNALHVYCNATDRHVYVPYCEYCGEEVAA